METKQKAKRKSKATSTPALISQKEIDGIIFSLKELSEKHGFGEVRVSIFAGSVAEVAVFKHDPENARHPVATYEIETGKEWVQVG